MLKGRMRHACHPTFTEKVCSVCFTVLVYYFTYTSSYRARGGVHVCSGDGERLSFYICFTEKVAVCCFDFHLYFVVLVDESTHLAMMKVGGQRVHSCHLTFIRRKGLKCVLFCL